MSAPERLCKNMTWISILLFVGFSCAKPYQSNHHPKHDDRRRLRAIEEAEKPRNNGYVLSGGFLGAHPYECSDHKDSSFQIGDSGIFQVNRIAAGNQNTSDACSYFYFTDWLADATGAICLHTPAPVYGAESLASRIEITPDVNETDISLNDLESVSYRMYPEECKHINISQGSGQKVKRLGPCTNQIRLHLYIRDENTPQDCAYSCRLVFDATQSHNDEKIEYSDNPLRMTIPTRRKNRSASTIGIPLEMHQWSNVQVDRQTLITAVEQSPCGACHHNVVAGRSLSELEEYNYFVGRRDDVGTPLQHAIAITLGISDYDESPPSDDVSLPTRHQKVNACFDSVSYKFKDKGTTSFRFQLG